MVFFAYFCKIAGAACIVFSCIKFGMKYRRQLRMHKEMLDSLKSGLEFLEGKIVMGEEILEQGMRECGKRFFEKEEGNDVFSLYAEKLSEGELSGDECWIRAISECRSCGIMQQEEEDLLAGLSSTLGTADTEHHSSHILSVASKLGKLSDSANQKLKRDGGLVLKLSAALSAVIILLLW